MQLLKDRILTDGVVKEGNILKVDSFLNHQMDIDLINEVGKEFKKRFDHCPITKILTIEASGIGIACIAAQYFHVPVVFAKKAQSVNLDGEMYTTKVESFTHKKVYDVILSKKFLGPEDHVLLIDDFLANGCALLGLIDIVKKSGATLEGAGIVIEKGFQSGAVFAANIYEKLGFPVVPNSTEPRQDIIQAVTLGTPEGLVAFCQGIQAAAPVDSFVTPEPWDMPGYDSQVIMAAGAFIQGSSIELSADGPMKPPYAVYFQGGLTWEHAKLGILKSLQYMVDKELVKL